MDEFTTKELREIFEALHDRLDGPLLEQRREATQSALEKIAEELVMRE